MERTQISTSQFLMLHNLPQRTAHWALSYSNKGNIQHTKSLKSMQRLRANKISVKRYHYAQVTRIYIQCAFEPTFSNKLHFYRCTVHFDIYKVHTPTNALFIKRDKDLKFTLKITLICSYIFQSTAIIKEPSPEPS